MSDLTSPFDFDAAIAKREELIAEILENSSYLVEIIDNRVSEAVMSFTPSVTVYVCLGKERRLEEGPTQQTSDFQSRMIDYFAGLLSTRYKRGASVQLRDDNAIVIFIKST
jgi:hypothetical protein